MSEPGAKDSNQIKPSDNKTKPPKKAEKSKSGLGLVVFLLLLTFVIAISGIAGGYYVWQQIQTELSAAKEQRNSLESAVASIDQNPKIKKITGGFNSKLKSTQNDVAKLNDQVDTINEEQQRLGDVVTRTSDTINRGEVGWMLSEVQYVLRLAQHRLLLDRDFEGATLGLTAADERLNAIKDVRLIPVRQAIAKQIQALRDFPHPDYVGMQLKLDNSMSALRSGLVNLPKDKKNPKHKDTETEEEVASKGEENFSELTLAYVKGTLDKAKSAFNETYKVTHGEQQISLFIEEQEKKRAYEFLRQKLLGAKYAVSTRDEQSFQKQLNAASSWLESSDEFANKKQLLDDINQLKKTRLLPELPDISQPSSLLEVYIANRKENK